MILIDALYINMGGALGLLRYLVETLREKKVDFFLLADARVGDEFMGLPHVERLTASLSNRSYFYKKHKEDFESVFCFGNVPPPVKLTVPVYTYFHNVNMLTLANCRSRKQRLLFWLKREYIRYLKGHSDKWFVQTSNTANEVIRDLGIRAERVKIYPFYRPIRLQNIEQKPTDYIFVGEYSGSKGHRELLEALKLLHKRGFDTTLHLTVSEDDDFLHQLKDGVKAGVKIINHGHLPMVELAMLYQQSKATVYPSFNESFGLGLVEAMEAGCDVIAADRPYVYSICEPSEVFDPKSPQSIADAILKYETGNSPRTKQIVKNCINEMINELE